MTCHANDVAWRPASRLTLLDWHEERNDADTLVTGETGAAGSIPA